MDTNTTKEDTSNTISSTYFLFPLYTEEEKRVAGSISSVQGNAINTYTFHLMKRYPDNVLPRTGEPTHTDYNKNQEHTARHGRLRCVLVKTAL